MGCQGGQAPLSGDADPWCHPCYGQAVLGLLYGQGAEEQRGVCLGYAAGVDAPTAGFWVAVQVAGSEFGEGPGSPGCTMAMVVGGMLLPQRALLP